jgi:hypothetical protein
VTTTVVQAYRFALDPTPEHDAVLRSHCGGQRFAFNWGLALVQPGAAAGREVLRHPRRRVDAVVVLVGL